MKKAAPVSGGRLGMDWSVRNCWLGGGFFRLAGAEGVEDAPFAGAAAEGGGFQLAERELDFIPDVLDDLVRIGAEGGDVGLFGFQGVLGFGLEGELGLIGVEGRADIRSGGHGHGGLAELGDAAGIPLHDAVRPEEEIGFRFRVRSVFLVHAQFVNGAAGGGENMAGDAELIDLEKVTDREAESGGEGDETGGGGGLCAEGIGALGDFLVPLGGEGAEGGRRIRADEFGGGGCAVPFLGGGVDGLGAGDVGGRQLAIWHRTEWLVVECLVARGVIGRRRLKLDDS